MEKPNLNKKKQLYAMPPLACFSEGIAYYVLEQLRWGKSVTCPRCGSKDVYQVRNRKTGERERHRRWRCRDCPKTGLFNIRTGTIMEDSLVPLRHWCFAFWAYCYCDKMTARHLQQQTGLTYKTALFLLNRVKFALSDWKNWKTT